MLKINKSIRRTTNRQRILDSFALYASKEGQSLSIGDLAKASGLTRSQVHGSAWALANEGLLHRVSEGVYALSYDDVEHGPAQPTDAVVTAPAQSNGDSMRHGFQIPHVEWPMPEPAPEVTEPEVHRGIGLTAFLAEQFNLDPADVELALSFYDRFVGAPKINTEGQ
jgi:hypothetical protein